MKERKERNTTRSRPQTGGNDVTRKWAELALNLPVCVLTAPPPKNQLLIRRDKHDDVVN